MFIHCSSILAILHNKSRRHYLPYTTSWQMRELEQGGTSNKCKVQLYVCVRAISVIFWLPGECVPHTFIRLLDHILYNGVWKQGKGNLLCSVPPPVVQTGHCPDSKGDTSWMMGWSMFIQCTRATGSILSSCSSSVWSMYSLIRHHGECDFYTKSRCFGNQVEITVMVNIKILGYESKHMKHAYSSLIRIVGYMCSHYYATNSSNVNCSHLLNMLMVTTSVLYVKRRVFIVLCLIVFEMYCRLVKSLQVLSLVCTILQTWFMQ